MKTPVAVRVSNPLFNSFMIFTGFTFMLVWLPVLRCLFDGKSYRWGQNYFGISFFSKGIEPDYFILIPFLGLFGLLYYSFYWIKNRTVFYVLLAWWWIHHFGNYLYDIYKNGDTMFHGDTLGIHVSLTVVVIPLALITLLWIGLIIRKDSRMETVHIPWAKRNKLKAVLFLSPLIIQAILFAIGEPHGCNNGRNRCCNHYHTSVYDPSDIFTS